jgi:hypothetical protein
MGKYLDISRSAAAQPRYDRNDINDQRPKHGQTFGRLSRFGRTFQELERRCPAYIEPARWQQAVEDGRRLLAAWGEQAEALGWTATDLFGLHQPPDNPHPNYDRLSRYDATGLCWLLLGRPVAALYADTATIQGASGASLSYRRKSALGPVGASLDDYSGGSVMIPRQRLPNRRANVTFALEVSGVRFVATVSRFVDGTLGEIFLQTDNVRSAAGIVANDAAIAASLALQFSCRVETLCRALSRDARGTATSPLGVAVDLLLDDEQDDAA